MPPIDARVALGVQPQQYHSKIGALSQLAQLRGVLSQQDQGEQVRGILSQASGPEEAIPLLMKAGPVGIQAAGSLAQLLERTTKAKEASEKAAFFSPQNQQQYVEGGRPAVELPEDMTGPRMPAQPGQMNFGRMLQDAASRNFIPPETYANHLAQRDQAKETGLLRRDALEQNAVLRRETIARDIQLARERSEDRTRSDVQRSQDRMEAIRLAASLRAPPQPPSPHFVTGVDDRGNQIVHSFGRDGQRINSVETGTLAPSFSNNTNIAERQMRTQLEATLKPHLDVMNASQRFEQIRATGDNSQANQFLVAQLQQMSKTGQRAVPIAELNRALGTSFEGNDALGRIGNYVSQLATGTRTAETDRKINALADAMSSASAQRIGQEIQNVRARVPPGLDAERLVGASPRIYGRFVITPDGQVFAGKNAADAQAKLVKMMQAAQQQPGTQ